MKVSYRNLIRDIWKIAFPISLQALLISALQLVDNLFIGHLHDATYVASGINAVNNVTFIIGSLVTGFVAGIGVYFTQVAATQDVKKQQDLFKAKFWWMVILSFILIGIVSLFFKHIISLWISTKGDYDKSLNFASEYGYIVIPSLVLDFIVVIYANSYKEIKKTKVAVIVAILALVLNATLNYILMYVVKLGVRGSAYATLTARIFEIIIWCFYVYKTRPTFIPKFFQLFDINFIIFKKVFAKSLLWSINGFLLSLAFTIQIMIISNISNNAGASLNSAGVFLQLIYAFTGGFAQAVGILIVAYMSNKTIKEIHSYIVTMSKIAIVFGLICGLVITLFSPLMILIYPRYDHSVNIQSIIMIGAVGLTIWPSLFIGVLFAVLKGSGFSKSLIVIDALVSWLVSIPITFSLVYSRVNIEYGWIYFAVSCSIFVKLPIVIIFYQKNIHKIKQLEI